MTKRRFSAEEKYRILEEERQPGTTVAEVCRRHQITSSLSYKWEVDVKRAALAALSARKNVLVTYSLGYISIRRKVEQRGR